MYIGKKKWLYNDNKFMHNSILVSDALVAIGSTAYYFYLKYNSQDADKINFAAKSAAYAPLHVALTLYTLFVMDPKNDSTFSCPPFRHTVLIKEGICPEGYDVIPETMSWPETIQLCGTLITDATY